MITKSRIFFVISNAIFQTYALRFPIHQRKIERKCFFLAAWTDNVINIEICSRSIRLLLCCCSNGKTPSRLSFVAESFSSTTTHKEARGPGTKESKLWSHALLYILYILVAWQESECIYFMSSARIYTRIY